MIMEMLLNNDIKKNVQMILHFQKEMMYIIEKQI